MPLNEDMQQPPQSQGASDQQVSASVNAYMADHAADLKGAKGDIGSQGPKGDPGVQGAKGDAGAKGDQGIQGFKGDAGQPGTSGAKGDTGSPGDSYVKVRSKVNVAAQSTVGTYTLPAINFGANKFTQSPVISCDIECAANTQMMSVTWTTGGAASTGFTMTPTVKAMNTTVTLSVLGVAVNLLTTVPACTLHITASEPS